MDQSSKHSPRAEPSLDVELDSEELRDEVMGEPVTIDADRRDAVPDVDVVFAPDVVERSDLAIVLRPDAFPAEPGVLIAVAEEEGAPPEILARLAQLPSREYRTVGEVWEALGGPVEHRGVEPPTPREPEPVEADEPVVTGMDNEDLVAEMEAEFDALDEEVEEQLAALPDELAVLEEEPEPQPEPVPPPRGGGARPPTARRNPLEPVAILAALPLRLSARWLRAQADILERIADAVPGARR